MSLCGVGVLVMAASFAVVAATATEKATWETVDAEGICDGGVCANLMLLQSHMAMKEDMRNTNQVMVEKNSEKVMQDKDDVCSACGSGYKCYVEFGNSQICLTMADATAFCSGTVCLSGEAAVTTTSTTTTTTTTTTTATVTEDVCSACGSGYKCYVELGNSQICLTMADATAFCGGTVCLSGEAAVTTTGTTTTQTTITVTFTTQTIDVLIPDFYASEGGGLGVNDIDIDDAGLSLD